MVDVKKSQKASQRENGQDLKKKKVKLGEGLGGGEGRKGKGRKRRKGGVIREKGKL